MNYLKFKSLKTVKRENKSNTLKRFFISSSIEILKKIIPEANPDYENEIDSVNYWLVEFDKKDLPIREIGLDQNDNVMMVMPNGINYGYWTDNNLAREDFEKHFETETIKKEVFDEFWNEFGVKKKY